MNTHMNAAMGSTMRQGSRLRRMKKITKTGTVGIRSAPSVNGMNHPAEEAPHRSKVFTGRWLILLDVHGIFCTWARVEAFLLHATALENLIDQAREQNTMAPVHNKG